MTNSALLRYGLIVVGLGITAISVSADYIGLGQEWGTGFGYKQWIGTIAGIVMILAGIVLGQEREAKEA